MNKILIKLFNKRLNMKRLLRIKLLRIIRLIKKVDISLLYFVRKRLLWKDDNLFRKLRMCRK